jgi:hypothetical protein
MGFYAHTQVLRLHKLLYSRAAGTETSKQLLGGCKTVLVSSRCGCRLQPNSGVAARVTASKPPKAPRDAQHAWLQGCAAEGALASIPALRAAACRCSASAATAASEVCVLVRNTTIDARRGSMQSRDTGAIWEALAVPAAESSRNASYSDPCGNCTSRPDC